MTNLTHKTAIENWNELASRDGIIRGKWQGQDAQGRRIACFLGALSPDIEGVSDCKVDWLPDWLAEMTPSLDDNTSKTAWPSVMQRYGAVLAQIDKLTPEASDRARDKTMIASLEIALPHDKNDVVAPVIALLKRRIAGEDVAEEMEKARKAAAEAAWASAAWAAAWAAWAEWAEAAAWTAAWAAEARATRATRAAWDKIADACLGALETELGMPS